MAALRKTVGRTEVATDRSPVGVDFATTMILVTSELATNPIDCAFDGSFGPGATRWIAGTDGVQSITLVFDEPRDVRHVILEIEDREHERTQQVSVAASQGGDRFEELVRQEYVFSPAGATFERESWALGARAVTHLRITIIPEKGGGGRATMTALAIS